MRGGGEEGSTLTCAPKYASSVASSKVSLVTGRVLATMRGSEVSTPAEGGSGGGPR